MGGVTNEIRVLKNHKQKVGGDVVGCRVCCPSCPWKEKCKEVDAPLEVHIESLDCIKLSTVLGVLWLGQWPAAACGVAVAGIVQWFNREALFSRLYEHFEKATWSIIPVSKWLITMVSKSPK